MFHIALLLHQLQNRDGKFEKDRHHHLNLRTAGIAEKRMCKVRSAFVCAGILAGMRPCGIIVLVGELFVAESKTQVYGFLHNFFSRHPKVIEKLGIVLRFYTACGG